MLTKKQLVLKGYMSQGDWSESEIKRFLQRRDAFMRNGQSEVDADRLAERLLNRDRPGSGDDRRLCFECTQFVAGRCESGQAANQFVLQRCDYFQLRGRAQK